VIDRLKTFGTASAPLRASRLPALLQCPWSDVLKWLEEGDRSGEAADTGSAVHAAIAAYHRGVSDPLTAAQENQAEYPLADFHEAARHFTAYIADPANHLDAVSHVETEVVYRIPAKGRAKEIVIQGTLDQIRRDGTVWDVKTGKRDGVELLYYHAPQLAAYVLAARQSLGIDVRPGGIIRTAGYFARSGPAPFFHASWTVQDCETIIQQVVDTVMSIRAGKVRLTPGGHCRWCPAVGPANCVPLSLERLKRGEKDANKLAA
jgi:hypothetical protein